MNGYLRRRVPIADWAFAMATVLGLLQGCSKARDDRPAGADPKVAVAPVRSTDAAGASQSVESTQQYAALHQSFAEATLDQPVPVPGRRPESRPDDVTAAGKNTADILRQVRGEDGTGGLWAQIRFLTPHGKRITYEAIVKTEMGEFHIELLPDLAPNHVRNFIALARAGYYDGLRVDYIFKQKIQLSPETDGTEPTSTDEDRSKVVDHLCTVLLAGCPLSSGEEGHGSIGYWLKPEPCEQCKHDEGTVGAWPLENAACKFYISLSRAPWMDALNYNVFGRIGKGLDVVRKISQCPQQKHAGQETGEPLEPIMIRSVTILQKTEE